MYLLVIAQVMTMIFWHIIFLEPILIIYESLTMENEFKSIIFF